MRIDPITSFAAAQPAAEVQQGQALAPFRTLPPLTPLDDVRAWERHQPVAERLFAELSASRPPQHLERQKRVNGSSVPDMPVNLLSRLAPARSGPELARQPLHANWTSDGNLLMATPVQDEDMAWAQACFDHHIEAVVSLGTEKESAQSRPCMNRGRPLVAEKRQVEFVFPDEDEREVEPERKRDAPPPPGRWELEAMRIGARADTVKVETRAVGGLHCDRRHELTHYAIPVSEKHAISPRVLLAACRMLHDETGGRPIAFQSPQGDHRGAVFAAAHGLFQQFVKGEVTARNLGHRIVQHCIDLRSARSGVLFDHADHVGSLLGMGELMLADRRPLADRSPVAMHVPAVVAGDGGAAMPARSALRGARERGADRAGRQLRFADGAVDNEKDQSNRLRLLGKAGARIDMRQIFDQPGEQSLDDVVRMRQTPGRRRLPPTD